MASVQTENGLAIREELLHHFAEARCRSDEMFDLLSPGALYERPIPERHRIIFYLGHLEAFDWNLLQGRLLALKPFHPEFDQLFAFGIDPVGGGLPTDQPGDWPSLGQVREYALRIRSSIDSALERLRGADHRDEENDASEHTLLNVAIEHRLMHVETLSYMFHQLPYDRKLLPLTMPAKISVAEISPRMIEIPVGHATLGLSHSDQNAFGWDNEYNEHIVRVPAFEIDNYPVTNRQYLDFIAAGGYENQDYWEKDGWAWRTGDNIQHPVFWKTNGSDWHYRGMFREVPLLLDSPVYVSHAEASAYARWAGKSLPTEAQWHRAAYGLPDGSEAQYPWGYGAPTTALGNFDLQRWDPVPVNAFPAGDSAFGVSDLLGNAWEWTFTEFAPFAGFKPFSFYPGYSANFFDGKHYVMKGGSARTAACMLRRSFRNWFQPHYQYAYAGFRCVRT
jgi:ergothioneine biosynthesis protein EgtB